MFKEKMFKVVGFSFLSMAMLLAAIAQDDKDDEGYLEFMREKSREMLSSNTMIVFYGKVVDEDGTPLQGVRVTLNVGRTHPIQLYAGKEFFRTTDENGLFTVRGERGIDLNVGQMFLKGYERIGLSRTFIYEKDRPVREEERPPTKDNPAVFVMRKIGQLMPLLKGEGGRTTLTIDGAFHDIPLFSRLQLRTVFGKNYQDYRMPTLQAKWEIAEDAEGWIVTIKGKHEGDELLVSDQRFFEAQEEGYLTEVTIPIPKPVPPATLHSINVFLCLRTTKPLTYSKVETLIRVNTNPKDYLWLAVKSVTNPYGNRSLEQAPSDNLYGGLARYNFEDEAYKAIANGENPRLPTEKELLEFKAKREKEKAESDARLEEQMKKIREDEKKKKR